MNEQRFNPQIIIKLFQIIDNCYHYYFCQNMRQLFYFPILAYLVNQHFVFLMIFTLNIKKN